MDKKAHEKGYFVNVENRQIQGLAHEVGERLVSVTQPGAVTLAAGETTVHVSRPGIGGRNQELVTSTIDKIEHGTVVVSVDSDGYDNTPAAGGIVDGAWTMQRIDEMSEDPNVYLSNNNTFVFLEKVEGLIYTEPVTANVADFMVVLSAKKFD